MFAPGNTSGSIPRSTRSESSMRAADDSTQSTQLFALPARGNRSSHNCSTLACTACGSGSITLLRSRSEYVAQHHRLDAGPRCDTTDAGARLSHSHGRRRHSGVQRARQHHLMPGFPRSSDDAASQDRRCRRRQLGPHGIAGCQIGSLHKLDIVVIKRVMSIGKTPSVKDQTRA